MHLKDWFVSIKMGSYVAAKVDMRAYNTINDIQHLYQTSYCIHFKGVIYKLYPQTVLQNIKINLCKERLKEIKRVKQVSGGLKGDKEELQWIR